MSDETKQQAYNIAELLTRVLLLIVSGVVAWMISSIMQVRDNQLVVMTQLDANRETLGAHLIVDAIDHDLIIQTQAAILSFSQGITRMENASMLRDARFETTLNRIRDDLSDHTQRSH